MYLINLNRPAEQMLHELRNTVKADAAQRVFNINTTGITFAVIDGGIDATHPAFLDLAHRGTLMVPRATVSGTAYILIGGIA